MSRTSRAVLALLLSCASVTPAAAAVYVFTGTLSGDQEVPPVATPGTGFVTVTFDDVVHTMQVAATWEDLLFDTTAAHIHVRPTEEALTGAPATTVPTWPLFPIGVTSGTFNETFDMTDPGSYRPGFITDSGGTTAGAEAALLAALLDGRAYFNIHTAQFPAGEVRADLALVPEPGTWMLMLGGFGLAGMVLRRRRDKDLVPA